MEEYGPNSYKSKEKQKENLPEKKVEKVILGSARSRKKGEFQKFTDIFVSEDISNVKSYIFLDVIVPAVKKAISDVVTNGIDMILYGESGKYRKNQYSTKVSYGQHYSSGNRETRELTQRRGFSYDDILFETRGDAESVLDAMNDIISQYDVVSVADLYDLADVSTDNFTANKYGWTDISGCKAVRVREGYILKLPKASPIN